MKRYVLTEEDRAKALRIRRGSSEGSRMRRMAELALLEKLYAELAMPEWYPER